MPSSDADTPAGSSVDPDAVEIGDPSSADGLLLALRCPVCGEGMSATASASSGAGKPVRLICTQGHSFDAAKQGYFNFLVGAGTAFESDSAEMILARERFQESGAYSPLKNALRPYCENVDVFDAGCGTGYYTADQNYQTILSADISKYGLRRAARHERSLVFAWDLWKPLPLASQSVDTVLNVFAPHNFGEFARICRPDGVVMVVTPGTGHLRELRDQGLMLGQSEGKAEQLDARAAAAGLQLRDRARLQGSVSLGLNLTADLIFMGPAGHHRSREQILSELTGNSPEADARFGEREVSTDFQISLYGH